MPMSDSTICLHLREIWLSITASTRAASRLRDTMVYRADTFRHVDLPHHHLKNYQHIFIWTENNVE